MLVLNLLLITHIGQAQQTLKKEPAVIKNTVTSEGERIKAQRYIVFGAGSMLAGGVLLHFNSRNPDNREFAFVGVGVSLIGLAAIIQSQHHMNRARKLKDF